MTLTPTSCAARVSEYPFFPKNSAVTVTFLLACSFISGIIPLGVTVFPLLPCAGYRNVYIDISMNNQAKNIVFSIFSHRLAQLMKEKQLTQNGLGEKTGIRQATISDYLKGKSIPSAERFFLIARALGVSMDFLWTGKNENFISSCGNVELQARAMDAEEENKILRERIFTQRMNFSQKLEEAIAASGKKKQEIAALAGLSPVALSKYINGVVTPKTDNLTKIAKALGVELSYFYDTASDASCDEATLWKIRYQEAQAENAKLKERLHTLVTAVRSVLEEYENK